MKWLGGRRDGIHRLQRQAPPGANPRAHGPQSASVTSHPMPVGLTDGTRFSSSLPCRAALSRPRTQARTAQEQEIRAPQAIARLVQVTLGRLEKGDSQ
jgi:hypothetical protein